MIAPRPAYFLKSTQKESAMRESCLRSRVRNGKTRFDANVNGEQVQLGIKKGAAE